MDLDLLGLGLVDPRVIAGPLAVRYAEVVARARVEATKWQDLTGSDPSMHDFFVSTHVMGRRLDLAHSFSWSIPTREAITRVAGLSPIVDVAAGSGYWAWLLRCAGADVVAVDAHPAGCPCDDPDEHYPDTRAWLPVQRGDAVDAARVHADRTMLLSWPPMGDPFSERAVRAYHRAGGRRVVYVGEWGGCCGTAGLFGALDDLFEATEFVALPTWPGINDGLVVLDRRDG